ncbi:Hypothetical_protein [Hexamita inflata]|uniref:Hypothetical_protein n=1 Tax=Hexamita inflata TaxID=28002 RepID=A0AA86UC96_9EUKA|nr:Hypothetical protein HINF_LOCUS34186 [Hexamita inflata]
MFIDFSYTVPLQRRTSGITRLSPYVPPYLRILPLNALHLFASTVNVTSRTQVAFLYWNSISGFSNLSDEGRLPWALSPGEGDDDGLSWSGYGSPCSHGALF